MQDHFESLKQLTILKSLAVERQKKTKNGSILLQRDLDNILTPVSLLFLTKAQRNKMATVTIGNH